MSVNIKINQTTLRLIKDDLTALDVEAFVFYARSDLVLGSGYGTEISIRGGPSIKAELNKIGSAEQLESVITSAGELKTKHIIHAVGPAFQEEDIENKLSTTIENVLKCADSNGITQLAFPLMGIGFYGILMDSCIKIMTDSISKYLSENIGLKEVIICANDNREYRPFAAKLEKIS